MQQLTNHKTSPYAALFPRTQTSTSHIQTHTTPLTAAGSKPLNNTLTATTQNTHARTICGVASQWQWYSDSGSSKVSSFKLLLLSLPGSTSLSSDCVQCVCLPKPLTQALACNKVFCTFSLSGHVAGFFIDGQYADFRARLACFSVCG